jgi:integrase
MIDVNPVRKYDKSYLPKEKARIRFLTKEEYQELLANCSYELLKQAVILAVETGLRQEELMSLKWSENQIDFINKEITVYFTKNTEHRTIPITPPAFKVLRSLYDSKKEYDACINSKPCEYVFFNFNTQKRVKSFKKSFATAKRNANIKDLHWHDLRHTFATWALKGWFKWQLQKDANGDYTIIETMTLYELQIWLGHKDIRVTQRYAHYEDKGLHRKIGSYNYEYE